MAGLPPSLYDEVLAAAAGRPLLAARPPRASAAIVPWRHRGGVDGALEVFWVHRSEALPFMPGWHAFPGGGLSRHDLELPVRGTPRGPQWSLSPMPETLRDAAMAPDLVPGLVAAALRELIEEVGLPVVAPLMRTREAAEAFVARAEQTGLAAALEAGGHALDAAQLAYAGRWLTPPFAPVRFDNRFFLLEWPETRPAQPRVPAGGELSDGEWIEPAMAIARWRAGEVLAAPPILHLLQVLAEDGPEAGLPRLWSPDEADLGPMRRIEFRPGVLMFPLATPTLPPAATTNAYLVGTGDRAVLVDPGSPFDAENEILEATLAAADERLGRRAAAIWLTHHHPDHVGGVERLRRVLGVPVLAHPATAQRLADRGIAVDSELADGERHDLGTGGAPFWVRTLHTPGHARGHLAFLVEDSATLLCGDLVSALSTIVIDPPEGDMADFLESLEKAAACEPVTLLPGHGPPLLAGAQRLRATAAHRLAREERIRAAYLGGLREPAELFEVVYAGDDVPEPVRPLAYRQIRAHLEHLAQRGAIG